MNEDDLVVAAHVFNDVLDAEQQIEEGYRKFGHRENAFTLSDTKFRKLFRLNKDLVRRLIALVAPFIQPPSRTSAVSVETKVLIALRFFATGSYQEITGSNIFTAVSQPSTSRAIREVTDALNNDGIFNQFVRFPRNLEEMQNLRIRFYDKYQFPGTIGLIDCTHVAIVPPHGDDNPEYIYVNRKHYHSLNVQLICDHNLKIINVNSRFPGSCHDAHIWNQSSVSHIMEQVYRNYQNNLFFLLGDSGYPLRPWLITPLQNPVNAAEERFNERQRSVRSGIERCNGVLKNRFRCLLKHRVLHYAPLVAAKIVNACVILHNMCIMENIPEPEEDDEIINADFGLIVEDRLFAEPVALVNPDLALARRIRQQIVANHFNI